VGEVWGCEGRENSGLGNGKGVGCEGRGKSGHEGLWRLSGHP